MKLFELFATLTLNADQFDKSVENVQKKSEDMQKTLDSISTDGIDAEISALDKDIADLNAAIAARDKEIAVYDDMIYKYEMEAMDDDIAAADKSIAKSDKEIAALEKNAKNADTKSAIMEGMLTGLASIGVEAVNAALEAAVQFAGESLDYVAESGTEVGNALKQAREDMDLAMDALKMKVGTTLAPAATELTKFAEAFTGVTTEEKLNILLSELNSYKFENLKTVKATLEGIFDVFETYAPEEPISVSFDEMIGGLESQTAYWQEYDRVMQSLRERGVDQDILAAYADGQQSSLQYLQSIENVSDEDLSALNAAYAAMEDARAGAAESINTAQLDVDEAVDQTLGTIARLATEVTTEDAEQNVFKFAHGIVDALSSQYPEITYWVDAINDKIASLGSAIHYSSSEYVHSGAIGNGFATGLDYVPYDDYMARLHEGEAVLTKAEASDWRKGGDYAPAAAIDYGQMAAAVASALSGMTVQMSGRAVGELVAPTVSAAIARDAYAGRYAR